MRTKSQSDFARVVRSARRRQVLAPTPALRAACAAASARIMATHYALGELSEEGSLTARTLLPHTKPMALAIKLVEVAVDWTIARTPGLLSSRCFCVGPADEI
jgi:hypothetical protein